MSRTACVFLLLVVAAGVQGQDRLQQELKDAWRNDPLAAPSALTDQEAALSLEAAQRSWWPVASLKSPALVSASGDEQTTGITGTVTASLAQKLLGGGTLTAGVTQSVSKTLHSPSPDPSETTSQPEVTLGLSQPLAPLESGGDLGQLNAQDQRLLARLKHQITLRDLALSAVKRAGTLDALRWLVKAKQTALDAAVLQGAMVAAWEAQGRATRTEAWKALRAADAARWSLERTLLDLEDSQREWLRRAGTPAGDWTWDEVKAFSAVLGARNQEGDLLEEQIAEVEARLAERTAKLDLSQWAPLLSASASSRKPWGQPWQFSAQVGLQWSTDALVLAPVAQQKAAFARDRRALTAQQDAGSRKAQRDQRAAQEKRLDARLTLLAAEAARQAQVVAETLTLVAGRQLPEADLAAAEADAAQLAADQRALLWEKIAVQWENGGG